jgi:peptidyl-prolyl cis-trans isomerase A (cyclophilin A)
MALTTGTYAIFNTTEGKITFACFPMSRPITVANFVELAEGKREWTHPLTGASPRTSCMTGRSFIA